MEREMRTYLEWQLNVEPSALEEFGSMVRTSRVRVPTRALYSVRPFIWPFRAPEAEHQQHPHRYPILWPRCTSISTIDRLFNTSAGEAVAEVVGRLLRCRNGSPQLPTPPASHRFSFGRSISSKLDVPRHPVQLRRRQHQDRLLRRFEHHVDTGRQYLPVLPSCTQPQVPFANTSAHEDALNRHETYLTKEDIKYSSPRLGQVQRCLRLRSAMCMVKPPPLVSMASLVVVPLIITRLGPYSIFAPRRLDPIIALTNPFSMTPRRLGIIECTFIDHIHLQAASTHAIPYHSTDQTTAYLVFLLFAVTWFWVLVFYNYFNDLLSCSLHLKNSLHCRLFS
jgi:hypothetical protein